MQIDRRRVHLLLVVRLQAENTIQLVEVFLFDIIKNFDESESY